VFFGRISADGSRGVLSLKKIIRSRHGKGGIIDYCKLLCNTPLPAPLYCLQYCAIYFPHDPLYPFVVVAIKYCQYLVVNNCKGQVRIRVIG